MKGKGGQMLTNADKEVVGSTKCLQFWLGLLRVANIDSSPNNFLNIPPKYFFCSKGIAGKEKVKKIPLKVLLK